MQYDYNSTHDMYIGYNGCGVSGDLFHNISKIYKAEKKNDEIYVYSHFIYYFIEFQSMEGAGKPSPTPKDSVFVYDYMPDIVELPSSNKKPNDYIFEEKWTGDYDTLFNKVVSNNKSKTYKYTFKKQSNGNYYFVRGEVLQ